MDTQAERKLSGDWHQLSRLWDGEADIGRSSGLIDFDQEAKSSMTTAYMVFLATGAPRLSWAETVRVFGSTWDHVQRAVAWAVEYGRKHHSYDGGRCADGFNDA